MLTTNRNQLAYSRRGSQVKKKKSMNLVRKLISKRTKSSGILKAI